MHRPCHARLYCALAFLAAAACECGDPLSAIPPSGQLSGVICDEATGLPADERDLRYEHAELDVSKTTRTDASGAFVFEGVPPGEGEIIVAVGGIARRVEVSVLDEGSTVFVDPVCRPGPQPGGFGDIEGYICNRHVGSYVVSATVRVPLPDGDALETTTDVDGYFSLADVPSGQRLVEVTATGFSRTFLVDVYDGEVAEMGVGEVCEQGDGSHGYLVGDMCDPTWQGQLAGAAVRAVDVDGTEHTDVTDVTGGFVLGPMPAGAVTVEIVREPDVEWSVPATVIAGQDVVVESPDQCAGGGSGGVRGRLCSPNGELWLSDATVWIEDEDGTRYQTLTDEDGRYLLEGIPAGEHVVRIMKGSFSASFTVVIEDGAITDVPENECEIVVEDTRIAVVEGAYDHMGEVLIDIGIDSGLIDTYGYGWAPQLLGDATTLAEYDIVFINCGADESDLFAGGSLYLSNLKQFVANGGSVYASDWAYDVVEHMFPNAVDFLNDDLTVDDAQAATNTGNAAATVTDATLAQALGQQQLTVKLWAPWAIMLSTSSDVRVYVRGAAQTYSESWSDAPYTVGVTHGDGRVLYTSWHQEPGINVEAERLLQLLVFEL